MKTDRPSPDVLIWTDDLSVGHERLDSQHRRLLSMFNDLHYAMSRASEQAILSHTLVKLNRLAEKHFADEEALMAHVGYPGLESHRMAHHRMKKAVVDLLGQLESGAGIKSVELLNLLVDWLTGHIHEFDMGYAAWIGEHSAAPAPPLADPN